MHSVVRVAIFIGVLLALAIALFLPKLQGARGAAQLTRCNNNLKQIGSALNAYHANYGCFPPMAIADTQGRPLLSWRVLLLPLLGEDALYRRFNPDEPWDSPHNAPLGARTPAVFLCPFDPDIKAGMTSYVAVTGPETLFPPDGVARQSEIRDGASLTVALVEIGANTTPWTKPEDLTFEVATCGLASLRSPRDWGARHVLFADGQPRILSNATTPAVWRALLTIKGAEAIDEDDF
jgi:Protein of unknown function (DUF1559)